MADLANSPQSLAVSRLSRVMALAGWEISYIDLDLTRDRAQAEIKVVRDDGRWLWARVDRIGRSSMEAFQREKWLGMSANTKGRRPLSPQVDDVFLGRQAFAEPLAMLGGLTAYLADNALRPVTLADMRASWAAIVGAPLKLQTPAGVDVPGEGER